MPGNIPPFNQPHAPTAPNSQEGLSVIAERYMREILSSTYGGLKLTKDGDVYLLTFANDKKENECSSAPFLEDKMTPEILTLVNQKGWFLVSCVKCN